MNLFDIAIGPINFHSHNNLKTSNECSARLKGMREKREKPTTFYYKWSNLTLRMALERLLKIKLRIPQRSVYILLVFGAQQQRPMVKCHVHARPVRPDQVTGQVTG
jgi:hypothetical protein